MDWLATILTSPNAFKLSIVFLVGIIIIAILARFGIISFKDDKVRIGKYQDKERSIIRQQLEYADNICNGFINCHTLPESTDKYRSKYICNEVYCEMVKWISFNHITTDETYIEIKQNIIWSIITSLTANEYFQTQEMHDKVNEEIRKLIVKLVYIRTYYSK